MLEIKTFAERKEELIKKGEEKGYITFEELAESLKGLEIDNDTLDDLYNSFVDAGITVITEEDAENSGGDNPDLMHLDEEPTILDDEELIYLCGLLMAMKMLKGFWQKVIFVLLCPLLKDM